MQAPGQRRAIHLIALSRLAFLLAIPIVLGAAMWWVALQAEQRAERVERTLSFEVSLERLLADLRTAESRQRSYLLTGDPEFRSSYQEATEAARNELDQISSQAADNVQQQQSLIELKSVVGQRFAELSAELSQADAAHAPHPRKEKETLAYGTIQTLVSRMQGEEEGLLALREAAQSVSARRFFWLLFAGYGLIVLLVASLYRNVKRYELYSTESRARLAQLNAELDERIQQRTAQLRAREQLLQNFVRHVPAAVAMLDREMRYLQVSDRWCTDYHLDRERILGRTHYEVFPDIPERWKAIHQRCLGGEELQMAEDRWERDDGRVTWLHWEIRPWGSRNGLPEGILIFTEDITAHREMDETLRASEATNRALLETASQAILAVDANGTIALANRMAEVMFGYGSGELVGRSHEDLIPESRRVAHTAHRATFFRDPKPRAMGIGLDLAAVRKDGTEFPVEVSISGFETAHGPLAVSFVSDITIRKRAEAELKESEEKLRALAGRLITAQEEERRKLARDLHDDITQQLALLSIELGKLAGELPGSHDEQQARMRALQDRALRASTEVRNLSHGLHPSVITDFGLHVALEEFCDEFADAHGIRVEYAGPADDQRLHDEGATSLYRIAQESMRNAVLHGHATIIDVTLDAADGSMELTVADNGTGFHTDAGRGKTGLGIASMKERIRLVNGTLNVFSHPGKGAEVVASVPIRRGPA